MAAAVEFVEKELIGLINSEKKSDWKIKLSLMERISNSKTSEEYYDLRKIQESKNLFGKGITFSECELKELYKLLKERFEEKP